MRHRFQICLPCAAKLKRIQEEYGEKEMAKRLGATLCKECFERSKLKVGDVVVVPKRPN